MRLQSSLTTLALGAALTQLVLAAPAPQPPHDHTNPNEEANREHTLVISHETYTHEHDHEHHGHGLDNHPWSHSYAHPELEWSLDDEALESLRKHDQSKSRPKDKNKSKDKSKSKSKSKDKSHKSQANAPGHERTKPPVHDNDGHDSHDSPQGHDHLADVLEYLDHQASRVLDFLTQSPIPTAALLAGLPAAPTKTAPPKSWDLDLDTDDSTSNGNTKGHKGHENKQRKEKHEQQKTAGKMTDEEKKHIVKQTRTRARRPQKTSPPVQQVSQKVLDADKVLDAEQEI